MKRSIRIFIFAVCLIVILGIVLATGVLGRKPFKNLAPAQVQSAQVRLGPPDQTIQITEIKELTDYLNQVVIYRKDDSYTQYAGQSCTFTITKTDGTVLEVTAFNPFIIIDGVGYRCKYDPCEALNRYANTLLER